MKLIKINNSLPVEFDENFTLYFDLSDEHVKKLISLSDNIDAIFKDVEKNNYDEMAKVAASVWDETFSEGAGAKVYEFAGKSAVISMQYYAQASAGIVKEWNKLNATSAPAAVVNGKK